MLKFLSMQIEGFCSIPQLNVPFTQNNIILIKAPNGSGKSTIFSALLWVLFGKNIKGVSDVQTWKEFRTRDYKGAMVSIYFENNGSVYQIIRCQKYDKVIVDGAKGKDRLLIIKDADIIDVKGKNQQQQKILNILGLSQNLFTNSIMFGQGLSRLIQESNSDKKKLFEEIFDLNYLNIAKGIALEAKNKILSDIHELETEYSLTKREYDSTLSTYSDLKTKELEFDKEIQDERKELISDRKKLKIKKSDIEEQLKSYNYQDEIDGIRKELASLKERYSKAKSISNIPIVDFVKGIYDLIKSKKYGKAMNSLGSLIKAFKDIEDISNQIEYKEGLLSKLLIKDREYIKYKHVLDDIVDDLETIRTQLSKLKEKKLTILSSKYKSKADELVIKVKNLESSIRDKNKELEDYNWLINDPLSNDGIKAYLFDSSLGFINSELYRYANILGFHISFEIDLNSSRKEFVTLIERDGHIIDYDELSGGEKQLVDISMAFAMNQALTLSRGINIAFLDEVFESLSSDNIELVVQLIKDIYKDRTLFIISHHDNLPLSNVKILEVEKHRGLSYYKGL